MPSKANPEGWLMIDHRATGGEGMPFGAMIEVATLTCSHCQRQIVRNPARQRERGYCPKCDHYICDECEVARVASGGVCRPFSQVADDYLEAVLKRER